ncbi:ABC transporter permease [Chelatococcus asaccharovorans]|uniref:Peptide/nickel transport system permease protein n=1 Tax=Chelatococcus asaccharovorans TaxID=28210 RepID=A0A2V3TY39_9HYPH|nr:ABC transporter permease [Chelatococcus asaccharovorans]MBS7705099.1 ABC transporter permease [Chelatococcus asaccharovorans]PXW53590.1 peptide/nickel transport system permease protein [Chelatococcus asaccharovorans]CAH1652474.1 Peptide/nickel transport system permease protein [Chelatococcus asaccharovorans]CAH1686327.1 Peptide/nickel transport system permease protein [Chelatococcus asaccharovorans]
MGRLLLPRVLQAGLVILVVGVLCFVLVRALPGDAAMRIAAGRYGPDANITEAAENVRRELGLDRPLLVQLGGSLGQLLRLDLGHSVVTGLPITKELRIQLGATLWLAGSALVLTILIGPAVGLAAGLRSGGFADRVSLGGAVILRSLPPFVLGLLLILLFAMNLGWFPPAGYGTWRDLALPALTLALGLAAISSRVTRDSVAGVMRAPYFTFARLKGLPPAVVVRRHVLRNAAIPVIAYLGLQAIYLIEGVVVVETLFGIPGIGHALVHAVIARDVPMVQGTALVMGLLFVVITAAVDLICHWLDPRPKRA